MEFIAARDSHARKSGRLNGNEPISGRVRKRNGNEMARHVGHDLLQPDLQPKLFSNLQQRLGVPFGVVHGIVGVLRLPQMLEVDERTPKQIIE